MAECIHCARGANYDQSRQAAMRPTYDLYGSRQADASAVCALVTAFRSVSFVKHSSSYVGDYYRGDDVSAELMWTVRPNVLEDEEGPFCYLEEYREFPFIVQVDAQDSVDSISALNSLRTEVPGAIGLVFLQRKNGKV